MAFEPTLIEEKEAKNVTFAVIKDQSFWDVVAVKLCKNGIVSVI